MLCFPYILLFFVCHGRPETLEPIEGLASSLTHSHRKNFSDLALLQGCCTVSLLWIYLFRDGFDLLLFDAHHDLWIAPQVEVPTRVFVSTGIRCGHGIRG